MKDAPAFPGVGEFIGRCRHWGVEVCVISHKTREPFSGPKYDLQQAARDWLSDFFRNIGLQADPPRVFLELTKQAKMERIRAEGCTHFVDDLPEFLGEAAFPANVQRVLFDPAGTAAPDGRFIRADSWPAIERIILCSKKMAV
jgi:5'(3')-deoxyribonucleotidase